MQFSQCLTLINIFISVIFEEFRESCTRERDISSYLRELYQRKRYLILSTDTTIFKIITLVQRQLILNLCFSETLIFFNQLLIVLTIIIVFYLFTCRIFQIAVRGGGGGSSKEEIGNFTGGRSFAR